MITKDTLHTVMFWRRMEKRITLEKLSIWCKIPASRLFLIELGNVLPDWRDLGRICKHLNIEDVEIDKGTVGISCFHKFKDGALSYKGGGYFRPGTNFKGDAQ